jgi:hypothetical protein
MELRSDVMDFFAKPSDWSRNLDRNNFCENLCSRALAVVQAIAFIVSAPFVMLAALFDTIVSLFDGGNWEAAIVDIVRIPWDCLTALPFASLSTATMVTP